MSKLANDTRKKVKSFLKSVYGKNYGNIVQELDEVFIVQRGSTAVHVSVKPRGKDDCIVQAMSYVVSGAKITPKLLTYLMRLNANYPIGAYGLIFDDTITFSHAITGANLDANELRTTIGTVAFVADETDDAIMSIAGGMRALDKNAAVFSDGTALADVPPARTPGKKSAPAKTPAPAKKPAAAKKAAAAKKPAAATKPAAAKKPVPPKTSASGRRSAKM